jgi:hypothetical protein
MTTKVIKDDLQLDAERHIVSQKNPYAFNKFKVKPKIEESQDDIYNR